MMGWVGSPLLFLLLTAPAVNRANAGYPSNLFEGAAERSGPEDHPAVFGGDALKKKALLSAGEVKPSDGDGFIPNPPPKHQSNPFWKDFFGPQFNAATTSALALSAVLGVAAGVASVNPLAGFLVFMASFLVFSFTFNFLK